MRRTTRTRNCNGRPSHRDARWRDSEFAVGRFGFRHRLGNDPRFQEWGVAPRPDGFDCHRTVSPLAAYGWVGVHFHEFHRRTAKISAKGIRQGLGPRRPKRSPLSRLETYLRVPVDDERWGPLCPEVDPWSQIHHHDPAICTPLSQLQEGDGSAHGADLGEACYSANGVGRSGTACAVSYPPKSTCYPELELFPCRC